MFDLLVEFVLGIWETLIQVLYEGNTSCWIVILLLQIQLVLFVLGEKFASWSGPRLFTAGEVRRQAAARAKSDCVLVGFSVMLVCALFIGYRIYETNKLMTQDIPTAIANEKDKTTPAHGPT